MTDNIRKYIILFYGLKPNTPNVAKREVLKKIKMENF